MPIFQTRKLRKISKIYAEIAHWRLNFMQVNIVLLIKLAGNTCVVAWDVIHS